MIRFRYRTLITERAFGPMPVPAGTPTCLVYSTDAADAESELLAWAKAHGVPRHWLRRSPTTGWPHLEVWGSALEECGKGVAADECVADMRAWAASEALATSGMKGPSACGLTIEAHE